MQHLTIHHNTVQFNTDRRRTVDSTVQYNTDQLITLLGEVINKVFDDLLNSSSNLVVEILGGGRAPEAAATGKLRARNPPHGKIPGPHFPIVHRPRERNILRTLVHNSPPDKSHVVEKIKWFVYMFNVFEFCTLVHCLVKFETPLYFDLLPLGSVRDPCLNLQIRSQTSRICGPNSLGPFFVRSR
jgi:hypothetical protein